MELTYIFATVDPGTNPQTVGVWVLVAIAIMPAIGGLVGVLSYFATRREVDKLETRVGGIETQMRSDNDDIKKEIQAVREELKKDQSASFLSGERRSSVLHNRINPLVENTAAIKAGQEAQTHALTEFCDVMKKMTDAIKEGKKS